MRLFLFGLWFVTLAACKSEDRREGAIRVDLSYATFRPGCLTLTASDKADPSRSTVEVLSAPETADGRPPRSRELTVAVYRQDTWSRDLVVTAEAFERDCAVEDKKLVATQSVDAQVPEEGIAVVRLDLRATDLDDDDFVLAVEGGTDCNDAKPEVKPGATDLACTTTDECVGTFSCTAAGVATACVSTQPVTTWYTDVDGDGQAGTPVGDDCKPPVEGAVTPRQDCDNDDSPFASTNAEERCDRVDNNCNGQVDEIGCGTVSWKAVPSSFDDPESRWNAVAVYREGHAWVVGDGNKVVHVKGNNDIKPYTHCKGDWISAWAHPTEGRVFLGAEGGKLGAYVPGQPDCGQTTSGFTSRISGLVGFVEGNSTKLFVADSGGRIYRWDYPNQPSEPVNTGIKAGINLRAIHGTKVSNMLAVGYDGDTPKILRSTEGGSTWVEEALPAGSIPKLTSVHVVHDGLAFAAGEGGVVLMRAEGKWTELPRLTQEGTNPPDVLGLTAYSRTAVYVAVSDETVRWFDGNTWRIDTRDFGTPKGLGGVGPHEVWVVGSRNTILRRVPVP
ncbi:Putative metal-binding motif-containing protein [Stigmatella aurantiaca]|uniref:Putative metal-binding motif-containing protein n=1 Tax=Stigmatella aurantiaca TaxID=41 RepID=A0A1H7JKP9_STIAU|nr:MopE-related protein [Stigmatella aurantiaca]SEK74437.1 Putative metal-binding motif-containing protein [Stigmatella aurantiaca]